MARRIIALAAFLLSDGYRASKKQRFPSFWKLPRKFRLYGATGHPAGPCKARVGHMADNKRAAIIGVVTVSDRASAGLYEDQSGPAIAAYLTKILKSPFHIVKKIIPDGFLSVRDTLIELADKEHCDLILTTGGTGPSQRDLTPEATLAAAPRQLPGFGELMRQKSFKQVPTAILSRQLAAHRGACLVINLPGKPGSIETCLNAVFPAVPYCLDLIGAASIETDAAILKSFRPKP
jgi:molybdopterin adenylyltransferase